jgi:hypothetical protein
MNRKISNSMSKDNDPHFEIITPICKACKNTTVDWKCKCYGDIPKEYKYGKKYDCPYKDIDKDNMNYKYIKDKIK